MTTDDRPRRTFYAVVGVFRGGAIGPPGSGERRLYAVAGTRAGADLLAADAREEGWADVAVEVRSEPMY